MLGMCNCRGHNDSRHVINRASEVSGGEEGDTMVPVVAKKGGWGGGGGRRIFCE